MATEVPRALLEVRYYQAAQDYLRRLPLEHFMEATPQATQRKITLESFDLVHVRRPDIQLFNELLVQYPLPRRKRPGQVVPDNMVVVHPEPIEAVGSYDVPLQPVPPFWVLEYVSKNSRRKDYDDNMRRYERELKVPYYLLFVPDQQEITLYRMSADRYVSVPPDANGHYVLPQLELAVGLHAGWVRFWFREELLPLPEDLQRSLDETRLQLAVMTQRAEAADLRANAADLRANAAEQARLALAEELARLRAQFEGRRTSPEEQI
jgi:hypothetical protein